MTIFVNHSGISEGCCLGQKAPGSRPQNIPQAEGLTPEALWRAYFKPVSLLYRKTEFLPRSLSWRLRTEPGAESQVSLLINVSTIPVFLQHRPQTRSISTTWDLVQMQILRPCPELLNQTVWREASTLLHKPFSPKWENFYCHPC